MSEFLRVFEGVPLPKKIVTETIGILARKDSGKTYTILKLAEQMLSNRLPICGIDAMGVLWGLRASADGKGDGYPIHIMGGDHADMPLVPTAGKVVADLVAVENLSCILDVSDWRKGEQKKFVTDFMEQLYFRKKKHRDPLHVFLDEGDLWAPQKMWDQGDERMTGAIDDIVRRGRSRGIGCTLATQRPQVINKNVLSQVSILVAKCISAPGDIDVIDVWVKYNGTQEQRDEMVSTLSGIEKNEAWVWSPGLLKVFKRTKVLKRTTFDSSKTPELGEVLREPKVLAPVDIEKFKKAIAATVQEAELSDPKALKAKVQTLQFDRDKLAMELEAFKKMRATPATPPRTIEVVKPKVVKVEIPVFKRDQCRNLINTLNSVEHTLLKADQLKAFLGGEISQAKDICLDVRGVIARVQSSGDKVYKTIRQQDTIQAPPAPIIKNPSYAKPAIKLDRIAPENGQNKLKTGEEAILTVFCQWYPEDVTHERVGLLSGYQASGSTYETYLNRLKRMGYVASGPMTGRATDQGFSRVGSITPRPKNRDEAIQMWLEKLKSGERALLETIASHPAGDLDIEEWGHLANINSHSTLETYVNRLRRFTLVQKTEKGRWKLSDQLV